MKMRTVAATLVAALCTVSMSAVAGSVKVGMITTLSGGGSGLGIDVRDGFMLAIKDSTDIELIVEDDQRKPDVAVQLADKMMAE